MRPSASSSSPESPLLHLFRPQHFASTSRLSLNSGPTYVHLKSTPLQSSAPLIDELVRNGRQVGENVVLVTGDADVKAKQADGVIVVDAFASGCQADFDEEPSQGSEWSGTVLTAVRDASGNRPTTLIIESLDCLLDNVPPASSHDQARHIYTQLLPILNALDGRSKFIFGTTISSHSLHASTQSRLLTLLSSRSTASGAADTSSSSFLTVQLHPPATWRYLLSEYGSGLRPASTTSKVARKLRKAASVQTHSQAPAISAQHRVLQRRTAAMHSSDNAEDVEDGEDGDDVAGMLDWDAPPWRTTDPRLWPILSSVTTRSQLTEGHWWSDEVDRLKGEEIEAVKGSSSSSSTGETSSSSAFDPIAARVTLADLLGPASSSSQRRDDERTISTRRRTGWGVLTCECRLSSSSGTKYGAECLGVVISPSSRLHLVPLEMGDYRTSQEVSTGSTTTNKDTSSKASAAAPLPFNLSLTPDQRQRRDQVALPFAPSERIYEGISKEGDPDAMKTTEEEGLRRGSTGQSTIYFEPDSADEEDEEDPDEDLDI